MTEIDNDKLLRDFFAENKQEIADNGFSRRVMHHLPDRSNRLARIWSAFVMTVAAALDFATVLPGVPKAKVKSRVILTPEHAKRLLLSLQENITRYESNVGKIEIPAPQRHSPGDFPLGGGPKIGEA